MGNICFYSYILPSFSVISFTSLSFSSLLISQKPTNLKEEEKEPVRTEMQEMRSLSQKICMIRLHQHHSQ